jgi:hypothetical protein
MMIGRPTQHYTHSQDRLCSRSRQEGLQIDMALYFFL